MFLWPEQNGGRFLTASSAARFGALMQIIG
jgi:hypothetical protein